MEELQPREEAPGAAVQAQSQAEPEAEPEAAGAQGDAEDGSGEELATASLLGFIFVPLMLVVLIVGLGWVFAYLVHEDRSPEQYALELRDPNKSVRWKAALDLTETNNASEDLIPILEEILNSPADQTLEARKWTTSDMLKTPEEQRVDLRWYAAAALGKIGGERASGILMGLLKDSDANVRFYAVHSLGRIVEPRATAPLIELLAKDEDPAVRMVAAWSLGQIGAPEAEAALAAAFSADKEQDVRWNCAVALARYCNKAGEDTLIQMTKVDNAHTRDQARRALQLLRRCPE